MEVAVRARPDRLEAAWRVSVSHPPCGLHSRGGVAGKSRLFMIMAIPDRRLPIAIPAGARFRRPARIGSGSAGAEDESG